MGDFKSGDKKKIDLRSSSVPSGWPKHFYAVKDNVANSKLHPGFAAVKDKIASQEGVSEDSAGAILAAASRGASPTAKKKNPRLKKVAGY